MKSGQGTDQYNGEQTSVQRVGVHIEEMIAAHSDVRRHRDRTEQRTRQKNNDHHCADDAGQPGHEARVIALDKTREDAVVAARIPPDEGHVRRADDARETEYCRQAGKRVALSHLYQTSSDVMLHRLNGSVAVIVAGRGHESRVAKLSP